ncbi:ankyrin repeat domain-containing protein 27-like [Cotesia glomerata]|uniref:ankyrin repeat domain-containing protein 27-like n=1 Tax=Cotesia glomerata TaxID=32391 RepID=UPI001D02801E|nr:ankyrin repeat domain-containing protein 27-like [Cotesia glomerata]
MHCVDPALISGSKDVVEILLKAGVDVHDVNAVSGAKETTLMVAAYYNFTEIADFLLKNKANPGLKNENNYTDLDIAIMVNNYEAFYLLVESFKVEVTNQTSYKFRPLHVAAFHGRDKMGLFTPLNEFTLHTAASSNNRLTVKTSLKHGAYYDSKCLVDKKPIYMAEDELTLFSLEVVDSLFTCVKEGDYIGCLDCLRRNAVVNAKSSSSLTPLHYTCQNGFSDIVKLLLDFNADINIAADFGTPLVYAVIYKHYDVVKILLKYGAVYNVTTKFGGNSLARLSTNSDIIHLLELIDKIFDAIKKCDPSIVDEIKKIKYLDILQCILSTRNNNNKELYLEAQNSKFPKDKFAEIYAHEAYLSAEKYTWNKIL